MPGKGDETPGDGAGPRPLDSALTPDISGDLQLGGALQFYILGPDGRTPQLVDDVLTWGRFFESRRRDGLDARRVAYTDIPGGSISTVFLGLDHSFWGHGPPILFETMSCLGGVWADYFERYSTWAEAEAGHARIVADAMRALATEHGGGNVIQFHRRRV